MIIYENKWQAIRLKYLATINDEALPETTEPDFELSYLDIGNVNSSGNIETPTKYLFADAPSRARRIVKHGDIVISTVRTYLQAIAAIEQPVENLIVSTGFAVIRPKKNIFFEGFCKYALRESKFLAEVQKRSVGVSYPAINASDLGDIFIKVPTFEEQLKVSEFLDKELNHIDTLIKAKEDLLTILSEKRQALITQAVTKGIDFNVKMKDSGVEWLGEVPEHWEIERSRWLFKERNERSETGEEEMLTVSHITGVTPRSEKDVNMFEAESNEGYKKCYPGDLVINTLWAWMGAMGVAPVEGIVSPAYHVYVPSIRIVSDYIDSIVRLPIFAKEVTRYSKGVWSSRLRLYPEGFFEVYLPVPPLEEQRSIIAFIKDELTKIDLLKKAAQSTIDLLKERRAALITAAVTGQIEIPADQ